MRPRRTGGHLGHGSGLGYGYERQLRRLPSSHARLRSGRFEPHRHRPDRHDLDRRGRHDLNHQRLFPVKSGQLPPIEAPSGPLANGAPAGVRAYVFTYSDDPNTTDTFIGFLETIDPNVDKSSIGFMDLRVSGAETFSKGRLIRRTKDTEWVEAISEEGRAILKEAFRKNESGKIPQYIAPK